MDLIKLYYVLYYLRLKKQFSTNRKGIPDENRY